MLKRAKMLEMPNNALVVAHLQVLMPVVMLVLLSAMYASVAAPKFARAYNDQDNSESDKVSFVQDCCFGEFTPPYGVFCPRGYYARGCGRFFLRKTVLDWQSLLGRSKSMVNRARATLQW